MNIAEEFNLLFICLLTFQKDPGIPATCVTTRDILIVLKHE